MRFTRNSKVTIAIIQITAICLITALMAMVIIVVTMIVDPKVAGRLAVPAFIIPIIVGSISSMLWSLSEKLFPPIFDYLILADEGKIYFVFVCEPIRVDNNTLKCNND